MNSNSAPSKPRFSWAPSLGNGNPLDSQVLGLQHIHVWNVDSLAYDLAESQSLRAVSGLYFGFPRTCLGPRLASYLDANAKSKGTQTPFLRIHDHTAPQGEDVANFPMA